MKYLIEPRHLIVVVAWLAVSEGASASSSNEIMQSAAMDVSVGGAESASSLLRSSNVNRHAEMRNLNSNISNNMTEDPFLQLEIMRGFRAQVQEERKHRLKDRRVKAKQVFNKLPKSPKEGTIERVSEEDWKEIDSKQKKRGLNWFGDSGTTTNSYSVLADPAAYYDKWAQAYRMLGGFIDCDHSKSENSHDNGDGDNNEDGACSRWMMWAAVRSFITLIASIIPLAYQVFAPSFVRNCFGYIPLEYQVFVVSFLSLLGFY